MERPTEELLLPDSGAKINLYTYFTGGQYRELQKLLMKDIKIDPSKGEDQEIGKLSAGIVIDQQDLTVKFLIKNAFSKDGIKIENMEDFIFNLTINDSTILYEKVTEIDKASQLSPEIKKK